MKANSNLPEAKFTRWVVISSFLCSIGLSAALMAKGTKWLWLNYGLILAAVGAWAAIGWLARRRKNFRWFLSLAMFNLLIIVPELGLRVVNFRYESGVQFGYPDPTRFLANFVTDEKLFWRYSPAEPGVNSLGFRGPEISIPRPRNVYRMLFLGDSTTQNGYPSLVEAFLNADLPTTTRRFEIVNLAINGYSSHQGAVIADLYGAKMEPDIVFVYFGWNDHWLAYGSIDAEKNVRARTTKWQRSLDRIYHKLRILQGVHRLLVPLHGADAPLDVVRVPLDNYRKNLVHIGTVFAQEGVQVVFITAPTAMYRLGVTRGLIERKFARNPATVVSMHKEYNQALREVAKKHNWHLLDLESYMSKREEIGMLFDKGGIHFTVAGKVQVAKDISDFVKKKILPQDGHL